MKILNRILAIVLVISGLMPLMATVFAVADQKIISKMFNFTSTPTSDLRITIVMMGAALIFAGVIQFLVAIYVWKDKVEGLKLSLWVGIMLIAVAVYTFAGLSKFGIKDPLYAVDLIKGTLILVLTLVASKKNGNIGFFRAFTEIL